MSVPVVAEGLTPLTRAEVVGFGDDGRILVLVDDSAVRACDILREAERDSELQPGNEVLCWFPHSGEEGVVLGAVSRRRRPSDAPRDDAQREEELVIEATKSLTLRVGSGSITIREDGKILIKGKDLVSHATRLNRIKGGAVQIN